MSNAGSPSVPLTTGSVADLFATGSMIWTVLLDTGADSLAAPAHRRGRGSRAAGVMRARRNTVPNTGLLHSTNGACAKANQAERAEPHRGRAKTNAGARP